MRRFLLILSFAIFTLGAYAAPKTPVEKRNPLIDFQMQYPAASIALDERSGLPIVIANIQSERRGDALQIAHEFLLAHSDFLMGGGSPSELELMQLQRSRNAEHIHFQQVYGGVPVYRGVVSVHLQDGRVVMYTGNYYPTQAFLGLSLQPSLEASEAKAISLQRLAATGAVSLRGEVQTALFIYPSDTGSQGRLAYQVKVPAAVPLGDWKLLIDAHSGVVLHQANQMKHAEGVNANTNGKGSVYEENPLTTRLLVEQTLPRLDNSGFLKGDFVNVLVYGGPAGILVDGRQFDSFLRNNAFSQNHDFRYATSDRRFDEANVYFHINRIHDFFRETFGFTERDAPLPVIVGYPAFDERTGRVLNRPMDNAFFSPFKQRLAIGTGVGRASGGLNNLARDADVLYHEYTHAVIDRITELGVVEHDLGRAMGEAYADYFACTLFSDPDMGEWSVNSQSGMRNLNNNHRFPNDIYHPGTGAPEEHYTGLIWGGALWSLREAVGQQAADPIVFTSLYFLPKAGNANFQIGLTALLQADESLFDGAHRETIREIFYDRGVYESTGRPLVAGEKIRGSISRVERLGLNQYTIEVQNAQSLLTIELQGVVNRYDIDLYVRFNQPVEVLERRRASPQIIADYKSESASGFESITITPESAPELQAGTYYMAIVNWETAPKVIDYELTAAIREPTPIADPPPKIEIHVTPTAATIEVGGQQQFTAIVQGADGAAVIWQVNGVVGGDSQVGVIRSDGVYIAPQSVPSVNPITITAISEADRDIRAEILATIIPSAQTTLPAKTLEIPRQSALLPNYPNPFNPETWIPYQLAKPAHVVISIYDVNGQLVRRLDSGQKSAGSYISREAAAYWDGRNRYGEVVPNGVYFYHIQAGDFQATRRMAVVK
jgi:Zn-dependent metalloprotease